MHFNKHKTKKDYVKFLNEFVDTNSDGFLNKNELKTLAAILLNGKEPSNDFFDNLKTCIANASLLNKNVEKKFIFEDFAEEKKIVVDTKYGEIEKTLKFKKHFSIENAFDCSIVQNGFYLIILFYYFFCIYFAIY
jgi:hypothetical protein